MLEKIIRNLSITTSYKKRYFVLSWFIIIPFICFMFFIQLRTPIQAIQASEQTIVSDSFSHQYWFHIAQTDPDATSCVSCHNTTAITAGNCTDCHDGILAMEAPIVIIGPDDVNFPHHNLVDPPIGYTCNSSECHDDGSGEDYRFVISWVGNHTYCGEECHTIESPCNYCHESSNPLLEDQDVKGASTPSSSFFTGPLGFPALIIFIAIPLSIIYYVIKL